MSRRVPHSGWWGRCIREEGGEGTGTERNEFCRRTRLSMSLTAAHTVRAYGVCVCVCVCVLVLVIVFVCVCVCVCTNLLVDRSRPYDTRGNRANNTQCFLKTPPTVSVSPSILSLLACHSLLLCVSVSVSVSVPVPVSVYVLCVPAAIPARMHVPHMIFRHCEIPTSFPPKSTGLVDALTVLVALDLDLSPTETDITDALEYASPLPFPPILLPVAGFPSAGIQTCPGRWNPFSTAPFSVFYHVRPA